MKNAKADPLAILGFVLTVIIVGLILWGTWCAQFWWHEHVLHGGE